MKTKCYSYCSKCSIINCKERSEQSKLKRQCNGECYKCDGAVGHISYIPDTVQASEVCSCLLYHVQTHHDIDCVSNCNPEKLGNSKIERLNSRIIRCKKCKYSSLCIEISKNSNFSIEDAKKTLGINWNCGNEIILESIPLEKLYAFCICDKLREEIRKVRVKDVEEYMKSIE